jgi:hypothetical protein
MMRKLVAATLLLALTIAHAYDNSSFVGGYIFSLSGPAALMNPSMPYTIATGMVTADGNGNAVGHGVFRGAGVYCAGLVGGSYQVNTDGTGTYTTIADTSTKVPGCFNNALDLQLMFTNNGDTMQVISNQYDNMYGTFTKQSKSQFNLKDFSGNYALQLQGDSALVSQAPAYTVGLLNLSADGKGNLSGNGMFRSSGLTCPGTVSGTNQITPDGTGVIDLQFVTNEPNCNSLTVNLSLALASANYGVVANYANDMMAGTLQRQ